MSRLRVRRMVHRGRVSACGVLVDRARGEVAARDRVLALWEPRCQVSEVPPGWLVRWPESRLVDAALLPGRAVVATSGRLTALPLTAAQLERLGVDTGELVWAEAGAIRRASPGPVVDVAKWVDVTAWTVCRRDDPAGASRIAMALGELPPVGALIGPGDEPEGRSEAEDALSRPDPERGRVGALGGIGWVRSLARHVALRLRGTLKVRARRAPEAPLDAAGEAAPSWVERLRRWGSRWLLRSGLGLLMGRRQARYLQQMLSMFDRGELDAALRYAIPIRAGGSGSEPEPFLGLPKPRESLEVQPRGDAGGAMVVSGVYEELGRVYRRAARQLEWQERHREAAFVLAELLDAAEEAVDLLERHGELVMAAQVAEARRLPPGRVVRQWFLAGDTDRAVAVARRHGAFADAVLRLEKREPERAEALRLLWAEHLAAAGDFGAAVDALWPVERARDAAIGWMERAIALGGPSGARMLARKAWLLPEAFAEARAGILQVLGAPSRAALRARKALADALLQLEPTPQTRALARPVARTLLADAGRGAGTWTRVRRLLELADDRAMRADLPMRRGASRPRPAGERPRAIVVAEHDTGTSPVTDAAWLPDGRFLVALGDGGALMLTSDGRTARHFDHPIERLVVSDSGLGAVGVSFAGHDPDRVTRLDLAALRSEGWGRAELIGWAPGSDGSLWFVAEGDAVSAIDLLADRPEALWRVGDLGGPVHLIARDAHNLSFVLYGGEGLEQWTYDLPELRLSLRQAVAVPEAAEGTPPPLPVALTPDGLTALVTASGGLEPVDRRICVVGSARAHVDRNLGRGQPLSEGPLPTAIGVGAMNRDWLVVPRRHGSAEGPSTVVLDAISVADGAQRLHVRLEGATRARQRLDDQHLTVCDDRGRLLVIDLERAEVLTDLRV